MQAKWKRETIHKQKIRFNVSERESGFIDMTVIFNILSILTVVCICVIFWYVEVWEVQGEDFSGLGLPQ